MYTFNHASTGQTSELTDYRYIGNDPYNYVYFNCSNSSDYSTCEKWRIIGVFSVEDDNGNIEQRMKIIRGGSFTQNRAIEITNNNRWKTASLNAYLNDDYYVNSLSESSKNMIGDAKYYLGGFTYDNGYGTTQEMYNTERGTEHFNGYEINWIGKVGLMYPSDYGYTFAYGVSSDCYVFNNWCDKTLADPKKSWIFNSNINDNLSSVENNHWIMGSQYDDSKYGLYLSKFGGVGGDWVSQSFAVRPVVYLNSDVKIIDGTGKSTNPYKLGL